MKIWIIDDEQVSLFLTHQVIISSGYTEDIHSFLSAEEALSTLMATNEHERPAIILLDMNMPVMSGWEFLDAIVPLWNEFREKSKIFILTSSLDFSDGAIAKDHPLVAGCILKPFKGDSLKLITSQHIE